MPRPAFKAGSPFPPCVDPDDVEQEMELARIEAVATGFDPEIAVAKARERFITSERKTAAKMNPASAVFRDGDSEKAAVMSGLGWLEESRKIVGLSPPKSQTPGQRKRFLRNQLIFAGTMAGFSHRQLAVVFDLPHSRISAIVEEMRGKTGRS